MFTDIKYNYVYIIAPKNTVLCLCLSEARQCIFISEKNHITLHKTS